MPLYDSRIDNSAGRERSSIYIRYGDGRFSSALSVSNSYQKSGFYPGTHGIPDPSSVVDDGDRRDIDLPHSWVNHLKVILNNKLWMGHNSLSWDLGYQSNIREEWSAFHTHYQGQPTPMNDPDKEIALYLDNYSSKWSLELNHSDKLSSTAVLSAIYQRNTIGGYSFLLPGISNSLRA